MNGWQKWALVIAAIGAINVGLAELGWNALQQLIGSWAGSAVMSIVNYLIGLSGIYALVQAFK